MQRTLLIAFLAVIGGCAAIGIFLIAAGPQGRITGEIIGTLLMLGAASVLILASWAMWFHRTYHPLGIIGTIAAPAALGLTLIPLWGQALFPGFWYANPRPWWYSQEIWNCLGLAWIIAVVVPYVGLLSLARLHRRFLWVRKITIVLALLLGALIFMLIIDEGIFGRRFPEEGFFILVILTIFGTLTIPVLHRFSAIKTVRFVETAPLSLQVTCPRCAVAQPIPVGRSACAKCGLRFVIEIEENLCEKCGYSLYRLESAACPECGTPILNNPATAPNA